MLVVYKVFIAAAGVKSREYWDVSIVIITLK